VVGQADLAVEGRRDRPRADRVHADAALRQLRAQRAHERARRRLGRRKDRQARVADRVQERRRHDDAAALGHDLSRLLDREERAGEVERQVVGDIRFRHRLQRSDRRGAGVGEQDVDATELDARLFDGTLDVGHIADVGANQESLAAQFVAGRGQPLCVRAEQHHLGALRLEQLRGFQADARRAASDECNLVLELHFRVFTLVKSIDEGAVKHEMRPDLPEPAGPMGDLASVDRFAWDE
jgi:hypothetical protein